MSNDELILDALDNLDLLESQLISYERHLRKNGVNDAPVHIIFRYAHNLKGALRMLDLPFASAVMHESESRLDEIRSGKAVVSEALVSMLLIACTHVRDSLENGLDKEDQGFLRRLGEPIKFQNRMVGPLTVPLSPAAQSKLASAYAHKLRLYLVQKVVTSDISESDYYSLPILEDLAPISNLITVSPSWSEIPRNQEEAVLSIVVASDLEYEQIEEQVFDTIMEVTYPTPVTPSTPVKPKVEVQAYTEPNRILIVDDDLVSRRVLGSILRGYGEIDHAVDGREGIVSFMLSLEEEVPYRLVCLDINMPIFDGNTLLRLIRHAEKDLNTSYTKSTKIVMTSSADDSSTIMSSFREGCDGYIVKPFVPDEVNALMSKLGLKKRSK